MAMTVQAAESIPSYSAYRRWLVAAAGSAVVFFGFGCYYTFPLFYPALIHQFGWSRGQIAGAGSLSLLISGILSPFVGILADRRGPRPVIFAGVLLGGCAMLALSRTTGLAITYACFLLFGVGMSGFSLMIMQMLMAQWFDRRRGLATGLVIAGMGLGGTVAPLLLTPLLASYGWRPALAVLGVALLIVGLPATLPMRGLSAHDRCVKPPVGFPAPPDARDSTYAATVKTANFWLMAAGAFLSMSAASSVLQHLVLFLREQTFSMSLASRFLSGLLLSSVVGRLGLGALSDRLTRRRTLLLAYLLLCAGIALLAFARGTVPFGAAVVLVGLGYGGSVVMMTLTAAELFGLRLLGRVLGTIVFFFTLGGALGPVIVGALADRGYGYQRAFMFLILATVASVACAASLQARTSVEGVQ